MVHTENEAEVDESRAILAAHRDEILTAHVLDLGIDEFANVLLRARHWSADDTADQIDDLLVICGPLLAPAARALGAPLVSMDRQLLAADLAETPAAFASRVGLVP